MTLNVTYDGKEFVVHLLNFDSLEFNKESIENEQAFPTTVIVTKSFSKLLKEILKSIRKELEFKFIL